jgi:hypothetical protein
LSSHHWELLKWQRLAGNAVLPSGAFRELHRNEELLAAFADFMSRANTGMVREGSSLCLAVEAAQRLSVWRSGVKLFRKELQRQRNSEPWCPPLIDNAPNPVAELFEDAVLRDGFANRGQSLTPS